MTQIVDMAGTTINGISVLARNGVRGGKPAWLCVCKCGRQFTATGTALRLGKTKSCEECTKVRVAAGSTKHGAVGTQEYISYCAMKQRCYDPNGKRYARYGGRGITVCQRWLDSFANFLADMGPRPTPKHTLERIDLDKGYAPENCVWATIVEQANNRSNNTRIEIDGRVQTMTQWSRETGVCRTVILRRMRRGLTGKALIKKGT